MKVAEKPIDVSVKTLTRIYPCTPDGSQWEVLVHAIADVGGGEEVIAEFKFKAFNGGLPTLSGAMVNAARAGQIAVNNFMERAQENARAIIPATEIPAELKRRN